MTTLSKAQQRLLQNANRGSIKVGRLYYTLIQGTSYDRSNNRSTTKVGVNAFDLAEVLGEEGLIRVTKRIDPKTHNTTVTTPGSQVDEEAYASMGVPHEFVWLTQPMDQEGFLNLMARIEGQAAELAVEKMEKKPRGRQAARA